ncbi:DUF2922 domain-containing protein [Thermotoga profunda]|uniref:DUF2922 domain-containing protein n=1 Tax=Thermotoga profunda TaxID=1508420 RepID=UPI000597A23B|nr:DUF2922 domain-containing protein [Thermotoga profunda]
MKRLFLDFVNQQEGKRRRITIQSPKEDLTSQQVSQAMDALITLGAIPTGYVKDRAAIVETNSNEFFNLL